MPSGQINAKTLDGLVDIHADDVYADDIYADDVHADNLDAKKIDVENLYINGSKFYETGTWTPTFYFDDASSGNNRNYLAYYGPRVGNYTLLAGEVTVDFTVSGQVRTEELDGMLAYVGGLPYQCKDNFAFGGLLDAAGDDNSSTGGCWYSITWIGTITFSGEILANGTVVQAKNSGFNYAAPHTYNGYEIALSSKIAFTVPLDFLDIGLEDLNVAIDSRLDNLLYNHAAPASVYFKFSGTMKYKTNGVKNPNINAPGPWDP